MKTRLLLTFFLFLLPMLAQATEPAKQPEKKAGAIVIETTEGTIKVEILDDKAPVSAANFRQYVSEKFYDGLIFHRVIPGFMAQGGGFYPGMKPKQPTHRSIVNEADNGLKNKRGTLAMARTNDINSATCLFFINVKDNAFLDHQAKTMRGYGYAVFGKVTAGMDVVDKIITTPTTRMGPFSDVPREDVVIKKMYVE